MSWIDGIRHRIYVLRRGERYSAEVRAEMRFHRELDELARRGSSLGSETYHREEVRRMTLASWLDRVQQDVTYAWRGLRRTPVFAATFIVTLVVGLGINAAVYSLLDQLFTRAPAGVVNPEQIERIYSQQLSDRARPMTASRSFTYVEFDAIRRAVKPLSVAAFLESDPGFFVDSAIADSARVIQTSAEYFTVLGLRPLIGRFFNASEVGESAAPVAVISERLWRREYHASLDVLGRLVDINDQHVTIIGVAPRDFTGTDLNAGDVWLPFNVYRLPPRNGRSWADESGNHIVARINGQADRVRLLGAGSIALRNRLAITNPKDDARVLTTGPINEAAGPSSRPRETALAQRLGGVAFLVLLIACANLANLLLVRATQRRREFAVRRALGVSRGRMIQQILTESLVLCLAAALVAIVFASWTGAALRRLLFPSIHWSVAAIDLKTAAATVVAAAGVGIAVGLIPSITASNPDLVAALKGDRSGRGPRSGLQNTLLGAQAAVSVVLLIAAGLVVRTFDNIRSIDLGYAMDDMIIVGVASPVRDTAQIRDVAQRLPDAVARLRARPEVRALSMVNTLPMSGYAVIPTYLPGREGRIPATVIVATGEHFAAAGIKVLVGRGLASSDVAASERVTVVSEQMAKLFWPNESPLGKCIMVMTATAPCTRVVGIARDTHRMNILEDNVPLLYLPATQTTIFRPLSLVVRFDHGHANEVAAAIRAELKPILPSNVVASIRTMPQVLERELRPWRMGAILFASMGVLALVVACVGIYGVVAYSMAARTREMGIRIALGAHTKNIVDLVLRDGLRVVAIGIAIGVFSALMLGRLIESLLFGVVANDLSTLIGAVAVLIGFASLACLAPAIRAGRVDPVSALRSD